MKYNDLHLFFKMNSNGKIEDFNQWIYYKFKYSNPFFFCLDENVELSPKELKLLIEKTDLSKNPQRDDILFASFLFKRDTNNYYVDEDTFDLFLKKSPLNAKTDFGWTVFTALLENVMDLKNEQWNYVLKNVDLNNEPGFQDTFPISIALRYHFKKNSTFSFEHFDYLIEKTPQNFLDRLNPEDKLLLKEYECMRNNQCILDKINLNKINHRNIKI